MNTIGIITLVLLSVLFLSSLAFSYAVYLLLKRLSKLEQAIREMDQRDHQLNSTTANISSALKYLVEAINDIHRILATISLFREADRKHITVN